MSIIENSSIAKIIVFNENSQRNGSAERLRLLCKKNNLINWCSLCVYLQVVTCR